MVLYDPITKKATAENYNIDRFLVSAKNLQIMANRIMKNDDLCKLLVRNGADALSDGKPLTERERSEAARTNIRTTPVVDKEEEVENILVLQIADIIPSPVRGLVYSFTFDILCNVENWNLEGYIQRPYAIMNELDKLFSNTKMESLGPATFLGATNIKVNERLLGYTMTFVFSEV